MMCINSAIKNDTRHEFALLMHNVHHIGMNLAAFREKRGLSQRDMADILGVSQPTIQRAETGHKSAKLSTYLAYAEEFGVSLSDLFADDRTELEARLLQAFREMSEADQDRALQVLDLVRDRS